MRSIPSAVFGPVLSPPWSLQRPFFIAGHWQWVLLLVFAPHRAAFAKSPGGLAFLSIPRRLSWGVPSIWPNLSPSAIIWPSRQSSRPVYFADADALSIFAGLSFCCVSQWTPASKTLARSTATIPRALHSDLCLVAQSSRDLVQSDHAAGHSSRDISQRQGTGRENRSIRSNLQQPRAAFRLDRHRRFDLR